ncbi:MAG: nucleotidyltransferase domain-containing protein [Cohnella sp.]|nr:nucleotidyltransferase domain-containing protein [Cohnella sp.]
MNQHHVETIEKYVALTKDDPAVLAILLGGSLAHGFAKPDSDVDVMLIVEESDYERRKASNRLIDSSYGRPDNIADYPGGYVDCKIVSRSLINRIISQGSDAARYAFQDCRILWSRIDNLQEMISRITQYPTQDQNQRRTRFAAQLLAWKWYYSEGVKKNSPYLKTAAIHKISLFACRLILNENRTLFPFHKWLHNVVRSVPRKPADFDSSLELLLAHHTQDAVNDFCLRVLQFVGLEENAVDWPNQFLHDSEFNWIAHEPPIEDL